MAGKQAHGGGESSGQKWPRDTSQLQWTNQGMATSRSRRGKDESTMNRNRTKSLHSWENRYDIESGVEALFRTMCILSVEKEVWKMKNARLLYGS